MKAVLKPDWILESTRKIRSFNIEQEGSCCSQRLSTPAILLTQFLKTGTTLSNAWKLGFIWYSTREKKSQIKEIFCYRTAEFDQLNYRTEALIVDKENSMWCVKALWLLVSYEDNDQIYNIICLIYHYFERQVEQIACILGSQSLS